MNSKILKTLTILACTLWAPALWAQDCPCDGGSSDYQYDCDTDGTNESCEPCLPCIGLQGDRRDYQYDCDGDGVNESCAPCLPCANSDGSFSDYLYDTDGDGVNDSCTDPCNGLPRVPATPQPVAPNNTPNPFPIGSVSLDGGEDSNWEYAGDYIYVHTYYFAPGSASGAYARFTNNWGSPVSGSTVYSQGCGNATNTITKQAEPPAIPSGVVDAALTLASIYKPAAPLARLASVVRNLTRNTDTVSATAFEAAEPQKICANALYTNTASLVDGSVSLSGNLRTQKYRRSVQDPNLLGLEIRDAETNQSISTSSFELSNPVPLKATIIPGTKGCNPCCEI